MTKEELREKRNLVIENLNYAIAILGSDELYIDEVEKENAELKRDKEDLIFIRNQNAKCMCEDKEKLTKAKEIIENLLGVLPDEVLHHDYYKRKYVDPAEQFLSEVEK